MALMVHYPPQDVIAPKGEPSIFLAGPIQGAPDWQAESIKIFEQLWQRKTTLHIFNPRLGKLEDNFDYQTQTNWEKAGLKQAAKHGVIIFWFAARDLKLPYEEGRAYAQTSRVELGRVFGWKDHNTNVQIAIGIEPGYKGSEKYFKTCADEYGIAVSTGLEQLCNKAMESISG